MTHYHSTAGYNLFIDEIIYVASPLFVYTKCSLFCLLCHQGSNLDSDAEMWRLVADFMNGLGNVQLKSARVYRCVFVYD
jgi:hypothetical protein